MFTSSKKREIRHFSRRRPRGGQSGGDRRRRKFSGTDDRAPGMLLLSKQFHDSFECLSLNRRSAKQNKTKRKVRFPYNPIHLLCIHVSTLFILTLFVRKSKLTFGLALIQRRDSNEIVVKKENFGSSSLYRKCSFPLIFSNVGEPSWSWIPRNHIHVQKER